MVSVRLPNPLRLALRKYSQRFHRSQSEVITHALMLLLSASETTEDADETAAVKSLRRLQKQVAFDMDFESAEVEGRD